MCVLLWICSLFFLFFSVQSLSEWKIGRTFATPIPQRRPCSGHHFSIVPPLLSTVPATAGSVAYSLHPGPAIRKLASTAAATIKRLSSTETTPIFASISLYGMFTLLDKGSLCLQNTIVFRNRSEKILIIWLMTHGRVLESRQSIGKKNERTEYLHFLVGSMMRMKMWEAKSSIVERWTLSKCIQRLRLKSSEDLWWLKKIPRQNMWIDQLLLVVEIPAKEEL